MRLIFILSCIISLLSCSKDDAIPDIYTGQVTAMKNGEKWISNAYFDIIDIPTIVNPPTFILRARVFNNQGFWRENFNIRHFETHFQRQNITSLNNQNKEGLVSADYATLIDDGDVVGDIYQLDTTAIDNYIQLLNYNSRTAEVEGVFNVTMILSRDGNDNATPPQKIVFTSGTFRAKAKREWFE